MTATRYEVGFLPRPIPGFRRTLCDRCDKRARYGCGSHGSLCPSCKGRISNEAAVAAEDTLHKLVDRYPGIHPDALLHCLADEHGGITVDETDKAHQRPYYHPDPVACAELLSKLDLNLQCQTVARLLFGVLLWVGEPLQDYPRAAAYDGREIFWDVVWWAAESYSRLYWIIRYAIALDATYRMVHGRAHRSLEDALPYARNKLRAVRKDPQRRGLLPIVCEAEGFPPPPGAHFHTFSEAA